MNVRHRMLLSLALGKDTADRIASLPKLAGKDDKVVEAAVRRGQINKQRWS